MCLTVLVYYTMGDFILSATVPVFMQYTASLRQQKNPREMPPHSSLKKINKNVKLLKHCTKSPVYNELYPFPFFHGS